MFVRVAFVFVCAAISSVSATIANAAPSTDLVFCSRLPERSERLACYDAAARIAEARTGATPTAPRPVAVRGATASVTAAAVSAREAHAREIVPTKPNPFQGYYAALGGSYGRSGVRSWSLFPTNPSYGGGGVAGDIHPRGPSVTGVVGYNLAFGQWLAGFEIVARWGDEKGQGQAFNNASASSTLNGSYRYRNDLGGHVAARLGFTMEETLIFGKVGIGWTRIVETYSYNISPLTDSVSTTTTTWTPSVVFGLGIEHNFGRAFARLTAEIEAI
ncbi:unnamed protein product, partial [Phaeothamnion confervicola]